MKTLVKSVGLTDGVQDRISDGQKNGINLLTASHDPSYERKTDIKVKPKTSKRTALKALLDEGKELVDSMEEWTQVLYRAGTDESPSFEIVNNNEVWLIRNPALYYPLDQDQPRYSTRANPAVRLWKTFISVAPDTLVTERHPSLKEIVVVKLKEPEREKDGAEKLKEILRSMNWTRSTVPRCEIGMSLMNFSVLVHAVLKYLHDNCPVTPEKLNFQAELKAASHWHWFKENEQIQFVSGSFDDMQLKKVAAITLRSWINELGEIEKQENKSKLSSSPKMREDAIEEQISDLEEDIFSLRMYYNMTLEENDDTSSSTDCQEHIISSTVKEDSPKRASPRRIRGASTKLPVAVYYGKRSKLFESVARLHVVHIVA